MIIDYFIVYTVRIWDQVSNPMNFYDIRSITASVNLFQIFAEYIFCPMFTLNITRCHLILYVYYIPSNQRMVLSSWWRYQMETISALLAICAGNSPVPGEHWGQPHEATVVKMAPTRPLASRSFCLLVLLCDHRSLSNWQQRNTEAWYTLHQNDRLVSVLIFVQWSPKDSPRDDGRQICPK